MTGAAAAGGVEMTSKAHRIEIGALCIGAILICLWGIGWDITSGLITSGIDGIMLLLIALMIAGIFSAMLAHMLWQAGMLPFLKPAPAPAAPAKAAAAPAAKPAATATATAAKPAAPAPAAPPKPTAAPSAGAGNAPAASQAAPNPAPAPKPAAPVAPPPPKPTESD
jgi:predicted lipid-binding transport protein (Tim44 family)